MWKLWIRLAQADEPRLEEAEAEADIEIVVEERRLQSAREAVHGAMRSLSYRKILRMGQRSYYLNAKLWKPWVMTHDQGFLRVRGARVYPMAVHPMPVRDVLAGQPVFSEMQVNPGPTGPGGQEPWLIQTHWGTQSKRAVETQRDRVVRAVEPALAELRDAHWAVARAERALAIRAELVSIWLDGVGPHGERLPTPAERRRALLERWANTADSEDGAWARAIIEAYVRQVVQVSDHPFAAGEELPFPL